MTEHNYGSWERIYNLWCESTSDEDVLSEINRAIDRGEVNYEELQNFLIDYTREDMTMGELIEIVSFVNYLMQQRIFRPAIIKILDNWISKIRKALKNIARRYDGVMFHIKVDFTTIHLSITFQVDEISIINTPPRGPHWGLP